MPGQTDLLQNTFADLLFLIQRVSHKPSDAPSFVQHKPFAYPQDGRAYKGPFKPSLESFCKPRSMLVQTDLLQDT